MNRRIAKKWAAQFAASVVSLPLTLDHAKPSLWTLSRGTQRHLVYRRMVDGLGVRPAAAKKAAWRWFTNTGEVQP